MAFIKVSKSATGSTHRGLAQEEQIRFGSRLQSEKASARSLYIAMTRTVLERVGWMIHTRENLAETRHHVTMAVNEGTCDDAGFWLFTEDPSGYIVGSAKTARKGQTFACGVSVTRLQHYVLNDVTQEFMAEPVEFTVDEHEHSILVQVPEWLRYNPLSVPDIPKAEPEPEPDELVIKNLPHSMNRAQRRHIATKIARILK